MGLWPRSKDKSPKTTLIPNGTRSETYDATRKSSDFAAQRYGNSQSGYQPSHQDQAGGYNTESGGRPSKLSPYASAPSLLGRSKTDGRKTIKIQQQHNLQNQQRYDHYQTDGAQPPGPTLDRPVGDLWSWISELPQSADDAEVIDRVKAVITSAEQFVIKYFQDRPYKGDIENEVLEAVNCSSLLSTPVLQRALMSAEYHTTLITHMLVTLILELISYDTLADRPSLLPKEFQNYSTIAKARSRSKTGESEGEEQKFQPALSAYRVLSAYLRSDVRNDGNYIEERRTVIKDVAFCFDQAFGYWARKDKTDMERRAAFSQILSRAGDLGIFLFSQPSTFVFHWEVDEQDHSNYMIPVYPRFLRMYDESGVKKYYADHLIQMQQAYLRQPGSNTGRPGTSTGTGTPLSILEENDFPEANISPPRIQNTGQTEYQAYNPALQLSKPSNSPHRRGSAEATQDQGQLDSRNQSLVTRNTDTGITNDLSSQNRTGPSAYPKGPRDTYQVPRPGPQGQSQDINRRPLPASAQIASRNFSVHELDASEPMINSVKQAQQAPKYHELDASTDQQGSSLSDHASPPTLIRRATADQVPSSQHPERQPTSPRSSNRHFDQPKDPNTDPSLSPTKPTSRSRSRSNSSSPPKQSSSRRTDPNYPPNSNPNPKLSPSYPPTRNFDTINARTAATEQAYTATNLNLNPNTTSKSIPISHDIPSRNSSKQSVKSGSGSGRGRSFSESHGSEKRRSMSLRRIIKALEGERERD